MGVMTDTLGSERIVSFLLIFTQSCTIVFLAGYLLQNKLNQMFVSQRYSFSDDRYLHFLFYLLVDYRKRVSGIYKPPDEIYSRIQSMEAGNWDFSQNISALGELSVRERSFLAE